VFVNELVERLVPCARLYSGALEVWRLRVCALYVLVHVFLVVAHRCHVIAPVAFVQLGLVSSLDEFHG